jgi:hypothetical protein
MNRKPLTKQIFIGMGVIAFILCIALFPINNHSEARVTNFHSDKELSYFKQHNISPFFPPEDTSTYFKVSSWCAGCHGSDPTGYAMHDPNGVDVNIHDDWRATMMANSAKDPFWRAKVSHEVLVNPAHADKIENTCTSCHAPLGHYNAYYKGYGHYTMSDLLQDTIGLDGVSCTACHQMTPENTGFLHSGAIHYDTTGLMYGPYEDVFEGPMGLYVGVEPTYGAHINEAGLCASCHTLIVETLDLNGNPTGGTLVEQATYHEWLNSIYAFEDVTCQGCHMPRIDDPTVIATGYIFLQGQSPYGLHELAGANAFMLNMMKEHREELDIKADEVHFDSVLAATYRLLQQKTLDSELTFIMTNQDSAYFQLKLTNKAGHKFPSGYPSRIAFVEFKVEDDMGNVLFHSGKLDANHALQDIDPNFEPHYDIIRSEDQVQVYELVNGNVNGDFTTVLEHGAIALKDNRLPPLGFKRQHYTYDTVSIVGNASTDANFNPETPETKNDYGGGDGSDIIRYHVPLGEFEGMLNATATVHYQTLPPRWTEEMFGEDSPEINAFEAMYQAADPSIVQISQSSLSDIPVNTISTSNVLENAAILVHPNPSADGKVRVSYGAGEIKHIRLLSADGRWLRHFPVRANEKVITLPDTPGIYYLDVTTEDGRVIKKVTRK